MADNKQIATDVLEAVGGKDNVTNVTHCMTRLRFNLKDMGLADEAKIKEIPGVLGTQKVGDQLQVIIGQNVPKVYETICQDAGISMQEGIDENLDAPKKEKLTLRKIGANIMGYLSGSLVPLIPVMITAAVFKSLVAVFGPDMLNILSPESNLYILMSFVGDAGFYFFPVILGYTAAKKLGVTPVLGIFLGGILISPTVLSMVAAEETAFTIFGIPCTLGDYTSTVMPMLLSVWIMSYVERFFNKYVPEALSTVFAPFLTITVMLPLMFCVLAPLGGFVGGFICSAILWIGSTFGFIGVAIIGATYEFLVMTGMHMLLISQLFVLITENGFDPIVSPGALCASFAVTGMCLGMFFAKHNKEDKSTSMSCAVAEIIGGVTEPGLYGVGMKYGKALIGMMIGGFTGGLYIGLTGVKAYNLVPVASFLYLGSFVGGSVANIVNAVIGGVISIVVAAIATYLLCRDRKA